ncbi:MAG: energy transducer TonB [Gemmatimonadota bacterium]
MEILPTARPAWQTPAAAVVSVAVHLLLIVAVIRGPAVDRIFDDSRILPALYLYARDRLPTDLREMRLPIPAPPGIPDGIGRTISTHQVENQGGPPARPIQGLVPPGVVSARFDSVFTVLGVDSEVVRVEGSAAPAYPASLLSGGVEGYVEAEFVVDTTGWVDLNSVRILRSSHQEFAASVRLALMGMQFRPAWRGARRVPQLVSQRFSFRLEHPAPPTTL